MNPRSCLRCGARVRWAVTAANNQPMPLNWDQDPAGNQAAYYDGTATLRTRQLKDGQEPYGYERRYMPHAATCVKPGEQPPPRPPVPVLPSNVTPITAAPSLRRRRPPARTSPPGRGRRPN